MNRLLDPSSFEIYESIIEHNPDAIFVLGVDGKISKVNQMVTKIFGYTSEEIKGVDYQNFIFSRYSEAMSQCFNESLQGIPHECETQAFHKNGDVIYLQVKNIPLIVRNEVIGIFVVAKDKTELHQTKAYLNQMEERFKALFNSTVDAIDIIDLDANVIDVNPAFENLYGWKREEVVGKPLPTIPDHLLVEVKSFMEKVKLGEYIKGLEVTFIRKDGIPIKINSTLSPVRDMDGKIVAISGIARDITEQKKLELSLKESEERYRKVVELSPRGIVIHRNGIIQYANRSASETLNEEYLLGKHFPSYIHPDYFEVYQRRVFESVVGKELPLIDTKMIRQDGEVICVEMVGVAINYDGGPALLTLFGDVTERKIVEEALMKSEKRYRLFADSSLDLIQEVNLDGIVTYASPSHKDVIGYEPEEYVGKWVFYQPNAGIDQKFKEIFFNMFITRNPFTYEISRKHKEGHDVWVELKGTPMWDEEGNFQYMMLVGREVTERKRHQKHLEYLSYHDTLTGVANRRLFKERLEQQLKVAKRYNRKLAVMFMDLDRFKSINDTLGHDVGDELLKQFSHRVRSHLRDSDTIARQGGDEFTILLSNIQEEQDALKIANRIFSSIQEPWKIGNHSLHTTSSIGISFYPKDGTTIRELMKHADTALYNAKENGRNGFKAY